MFHFETDENKFECVECGRIIKVGFAQETPRPITCEECGTEYSVTKGLGSGLAVSVVEKNMTAEGFDEELEEFDED
jgi:Zn finger protein HypA/HybF involved in hydrogenase expression